MPHDCSGRSRRALLLAFVCAVLLVAGCTKAQGRSAAETTITVPPIGAGNAVTVSMMLPNEAQSLLATSFPVEVPVPIGSVVRAEAQGSAAWDYEIIVEQPAADVAQWYRIAYGGRGWKIDSEQPGRISPTQPFVELTLLKGGAQSRVTIIHEANQRARVRTVLGVGEAVLQTQ